MATATAATAGVQVTRNELESLEAQAAELQQTQDFRRQQSQLLLHTARELKETLS